MVEYSSDNRYRPFCSERCQLIDLGQWADEQYRMPASNNKETDQLNDQTSDSDEAGLDIEQAPTPKGWSRDYDA